MADRRTARCLSRQRCEISFQVDDSSLGTSGRLNCLVSMQAGEIATLQQAVGSLRWAMCCSG